MSLSVLGLCSTKRFSSGFPLLGKGGVGVVGSTTAQIYSEFDRTTPAPLLCQGGEFSLKPFRWAKPSFGKEGNQRADFKLPTTCQWALLTSPGRSFKLYSDVEKDCLH